MDERDISKNELFYKLNEFVEFSHSLCPDCISSLYPDLFEEQNELGFEE